MIIAFTHYKGGTGKTTSCINIAGWMAKKGKRVLVVDLDPQGNATSGLGVDKKELEKSNYEVMSRTRRLSSVIIKTKFNIDLAPSSSKLSGISLIAHRNKKDAKILEEALREVKGDYDFILIDTPPIHAQLIINGIIAADKVMLSLDAGIFSFESLITLKEIFSGILKKFDEKFEVCGVIITRANKGFFGYKRDALEIREKVNNLLGINAFLIPYSDVVYEAGKRKQLICFYKPKSDVGKAYENISDKLLEISL